MRISPSRVDEYVDVLSRHVKGDRYAISTGINAAPTWVMRIWEVRVFKKVRTPLLPSLFLSPPFRVKSEPGKVTLPYFSENGGTKSRSQSSLTPLIDQAKYVAAAHDCVAHANAQSWLLDLSANAGATPAFLLLLQRSCLMVPLCSLLAHREVVLLCRNMIRVSGRTIRKSTVGAIRSRALLGQWMC
jgi:hypothetical protein